MPIDTTSTLIPALVGGSIGVVAGQVLSILTSYLTDRRKYKAEQRQRLISRKIEVGEKYYELNGVALQMFKKNLHYFENVSHFKSAEGKDSLAADLRRKSEQINLINQRDKVYTAVNLYFDLESTFESVQEFENHNAFLNAKIAEIRGINPLNRAQQLMAINKELIDLFRDTISAMERDRVKISSEIKNYLKSFDV